MFLSPENSEIQDCMIVRDCTRRNGDEADREVAGWCPIVELSIEASSARAYYFFSKSVAPNPDLSFRSPEYRDR